MSATRHTAPQATEEDPGPGQEADQEEGDHVQTVILGQVQVAAPDLQVLSSSRPSDKLKEIHSHILRMRPEHMDQQEYKGESNLPLVPEYPGKLVDVVFVDGVVPDLYDGPVQLLAAGALAHPHPDPRVRHPPQHVALVNEHRHSDHRDAVEDALKDT